jgi:hypothetical protein
MKSIRHNLDGTTTVEYAHPDEVLAGTLAALRARIAQRLAEVAPIHDQLNAALGIESGAAMKAAIAQERARFAAARAKAESARAKWNGSEGTKAQCCEDILAALMEER